MMITVPGSTGAEAPEPCQCSHCLVHGPEHRPVRCAICGWEGECPNCQAPAHTREKRLMTWASRPVTADVIIPDSAGRVLLIQRAKREAGLWALPGGYVNEGFSPAETAIKEAFEEVGLKIRLARQFYAYGRVGRDPSAPNVTIVYIAEPTMETPQPNPAEVRAICWVGEAEAKAMAAAGEIAFDHGLILADYFYLRGMLER